MRLFMKIKRILIKYFAVKGKAHTKAVQKYMDKAHEMGIGV
jgi:hypothetical protein